MRPIEFRGMRADTGEWVYGNLFIPNQLVKGVYICPKTTCVDFAPGMDESLPELTFEKASSLGCSLGHFIEVIPETVGQFTGTTDKKGVKRFEGDRIRVQGGRKPRGEARPFYETEIVFKNNMFTLKDNFTIYHDYAAINISEVIGTIHDTRQLNPKHDGK